MQKIEFTYNKEYDLKSVKSVDDKSYLLADFIRMYRTKWDLPEVITDLTKIKSGEKTFADIQNPNVAWQIGSERQGEFECDQETAYFTSDFNDNQTFQMPLQELIDLLKEWQQFLNSSNN